MMIYQVATDIVQGLRDLDMEVLCSLPCSGGRNEDNGRRLWDRGASIVEMQRDFMVSKSTLRESLTRLGRRWGVRTGDVAPVNLPNGKRVRGGHCAFVPRADWARVQAACEVYWQELTHHAE